MRDIERVYKALADWNRLRILKILEVKPMCGCGITYILKIVQSATSRHLKVLTDADLIISERDGSYVLYSLNPNPSSRIALSQLKFLRGCLNDDSKVIEDKKIAQKVDKCDFPAEIGGDFF